MSRPIIRGCGTTAAYKRGCRCDLCRAANNQEQREYIAKVKARDGVTPSQKYRRRPPEVHCGDCGIKLATGIGASSNRSDPTCTACGRSRHAARLRRVRRRRQMLRTIERSAKGTSGKSSWIQGECINCHQIFTRRGMASPYCSKACNRADRPNGSFISKSRRRAIYERDEWICQLCAGEVDPDLTYLDDWAPSLDHIVPRSFGGGHEEANLRLVHRWCNSVRGDTTHYTDADLAA